MADSGFHVGVGCGLKQLDENTLEQLAEAGVTRLSADAGLPQMADAGALAGRLTAHGLRIYSICYNENVADAPKLEKALAAAQALGAQSLVVSVVGAFVPMAPADEAERAEAALRRTAQLAKDAGAALLVQNRQGDKMEKLVRMMDALEGAAGICLDVGLAQQMGGDQRAGSAMEHYHLAGKHLAQMYLADYAYKEKERRQPGYGNVPWVGLGELLARRGRPLPLFIRAPFLGGAGPDVVLCETEALLAGRVYTRPDGGLIGKNNETGRIIII